MYQTITQVVRFYMGNEELRDRLRFLQSTLTHGQALRSDGPLGQMHRALHWIGWAWEQGEFRPHFRTHDGKDLDWSRDGGDVQHQVREAIRHKSLTTLSYRRPSFAGVDAGVDRVRSLLLRDALKDYRQSQAMMRYHHCGAIYWGTAAAPGKAHDHLHHLLYDCESTEGLRTRWPGAVAHLQHSTNPFQHHLLVLSTVPRARDHLFQTLKAQAFTLLALQTRRDANDAWRKEQGQRFAPATQIIPEPLLAAQVAELLAKHTPQTAAPRGGKRAVHPGSTTSLLKRARMV